MTTAVRIPRIRFATVSLRRAMACAASVRMPIGPAQQGTSWDVLSSAPSAYSVNLYWGSGGGSSADRDRLSTELSLEPLDLGVCHRLGHAAAAVSLAGSLLQLSQLLRLNVRDALGL